MLRRLLFVIVFIATFPIVMLCALSIVPMSVIGVLCYIIKGSDSIDVMELILAPFMWSATLPYKIMGEN